MSEALKDLEALIDLAKEPSSDKRRVLLRSITDIFIKDAPDYSNSQSNYFGEIMKQLAYDLEVQVREELAHRLASEEYAPRVLMKALAHDEIRVAQPVLQLSPVLTQDDLIEISKNKDQEHLLAITKREDIGEKLSDVLVERGDDNTVVSLLRNVKAQLADETAQKIAVRAQTSEQLQAPLVDRNDVSKEVIMGLYAYAAGELKEKILNSCGGERDLVEPILQNITNEYASTQADTIKQKIQKLADAGSLNEVLLIRYLKEHKPVEFLLTLATLANIDVNTARRVLEDKTGKALVVVCKATKFSPTTFKEIAMSSMTDIAPHPSKLLPLMTIFGRFQPEDAQRVIRFWRTRKHAMSSEGQLPTDDPDIKIA